MLFYQNVNSNLKIMEDNIYLKAFKKSYNPPNHPSNMPLSKYQRGKLAEN